MKFLLIIILSLFTVNTYATTVTANVGGTLKVFEPISISHVLNMNFPTQYQQTLGADLYSEGASGVAGGTAGNYGSFTVHGSAGAWVEVSVTQYMPMVHSLGGANITSTMFYSLTGAAPWNSTQMAFNTAMPGSGYGQTSIVVSLRGKIPSGTTIVPGQYTGTINVSVNGYL